MKLIIFAICLFLIPETGHPQTISISGRIIDAQSSDPLAYASIQLEGTSIGTISSLGGEFN